MEAMDVEKTMEELSWERRQKYNSDAKPRIIAYDFEKVDTREMDNEAIKMTDDITRDLSRQIAQVDYLTKMAFTELNLKE